MANAPQQPSVAVLRHGAVQAAQRTSDGQFHSFDDCPESAAPDGVAILDQYRAKATFYVSGSLVDKWSGHWQAVSAGGIVELHRRGHEIACHTFSHQPATELDATRFSREIEQNCSYLLSLDPSIRINTRVRSGRTSIEWPPSADMPTAWSKACRGQTGRRLENKLQFHSDRRRRPR